MEFNKYCHSKSEEEVKAEKDAANKAKNGHLESEAQEEEVKQPQEPVVDESKKEQKKEENKEEKAGDTNQEEAKDPIQDNKAEVEEVNEEPQENGQAEEAKADVIEALGEQFPVHIWTAKVARYLAYIVNGGLLCS